jgi:glycosyltransferase involved in cell wall biosynthesis
MRLGIIARSDNTGLGNQTRELVKMLNPDKILLIDSSFFNKNLQHPEWYEGYDYTITRVGFPKRGEILKFLNELDVVLSCETFYSSMFVDLARDAKVKTVLQYNYEFLVNLQNPQESVPDFFIAPSTWNIKIMQESFPDTKIVLLPPPTDTQLFQKATDCNLKSIHNSILHIAGKRAARDRNGTDTVLQMLRYSKEDYNLVITSQTEFENRPRDPRLIIRESNIKNREDLYVGHDAMILPRRYAGLCLPMNEALLSALPVFMTNLSPNNNILPEKWLIGAKQIGQFRAKSIIDVHEGDPEQLAKLIDRYMGMRRKDKMKEKREALQIGLERFSPEILKQQYLDLFNSII